MRFLAFAAVLALLAGCTGAPRSDEPFEGVGMPGVSFTPAVYNVTAGTTVLFRNTGELMHTVTAADGAFDSGPLYPGDEFRWTFATPGTVPYYCKPHASQGAGGTWQGMVGRVVVAG